MQRIPRMPNETAHDPSLVVPGSWLRIIGTFDWHVGNGNVFPMERVASGTCYNARTPARVREILESYASQAGRGTRLALHYGDVETGEDWLDEFDMEGYIGRTAGPLVAPILVANARSSGGGAILDHCIVRIRFANRATGGDLYRHPNYHADRGKHRENVQDATDEARVWARRFADA